MKPTVKIATAETPDGGEMILYEHDGQYSIRVNGQELMHSRQHESELELARLGCAHLTQAKSPTILIGGLGLGYTLRETLDMLSSHTEILVAELMREVVEWNKKFLTGLNAEPLADSRVVVSVSDVLDQITDAKDKFDAILLDVDNGPSAMTTSSNRNLYSRNGIKLCKSALTERGCLAVWSTDASKPFEHLLQSCGLHVRRYRVPAYKGSKSQGRFIWVASEDEQLLPAGGGKLESKADRRADRKKQGRR